METFVEIWKFYYLTIQCVQVIYSSIINATMKMFFSTSKVDASDLVTVSDKSLFIDYSRIDALLHQLNRASTYIEWQGIAEELDRTLGNNLWKCNPASNIYDHKLIYFRLRHLRKVRELGDLSSMFYLLRAGLLRNLGGLGDARLFEQCYTGTKLLVESYGNEVTTILGLIADADESQLSLQEKLDFFADTRQSFGCSALILKSGTSFGLHHLGVVKTLFEQGLLPRIITGEGVGSMIAALVCIHTDEELPTFLQNGGIDLGAFSKLDGQGHVRRKIARFLKHGYFLDIKVLEDCVRSNVGDITFEEAYHKTKRVLNIVVSSSRTQELPGILNYITAPNVLIWSAACASAATMGIYESVDLLIKTKNGLITTWNPSAIQWGDTSSNTHTSRLAELFNVNHYIVSIASILSVPIHISTAGHGTPARHPSRRLPGVVTQKLIRIIGSELRHLLALMDHIGILPRIFRGFLNQFQGNVLIYPQVELSDFWHLFSHPTSATVAYWITKGERNTWPLISLIKNRLQIELTLDKKFLFLKQLASEREVNFKQSVESLDYKRNKSIH